MTSELRVATLELPLVHVEGFVDKVSRVVFVAPSRAVHKHGLLVDRLGRRVGALAVCPVFMAGFLCRGLGDRWGQALLP